MKEKSFFTFSLCLWRNDCSFPARKEVGLSYGFHEELVDRSIKNEK